MRTFTPRKWLYVTLISSAACVLIVLPGLAGMPRAVAVAYVWLVMPSSILLYAQGPARVAASAMLVVAILASAYIIYEQCCIPQRVERPAPVNHRIGTESPEMRGARMGNTAIMNGAVSDIDAAVPPARPDIATARPLTSVDHGVAERIRSQEVISQILPDLRDVPDLPGASNPFRNFTDEQMKFLLQQGLSQAYRVHRLNEQLDRGDIDGEAYSREMQQLERLMEVQMREVFRSEEEQAFLEETQTWLRKFQEERKMGSAARTAQGFHE